MTHVYLLFKKTFKYKHEESFVKILKIMKQKLAILSTLLLWLFVVSSCEEEVLEVIPQEITLSSFQREINPLEDENLMQILHDKKAIPDGFTAGRSDQEEGMLDLSTAMITYDEESGITRYSLRVYGSDPYYFTNVIFTKKEDAVEGYAIRFYSDPEWFENNDLNTILVVLQDMLMD